MICIYDFAGSYDHPGRWADIICPERVVRFGGWWDVVPDIPLPTGASANQAIDLANTVLVRYDVVNSIAFPITHLEKDGTSMRVKYWDELADSQKKYVVDFLNQVQNNLERIEKINSDCEDLVDKFMATVDPVGDTCNLATDSVEFFVDDCVDSGAGQSHDLAKAFYKQYVIQEQHAELSAILG